MPGGDAAAAPSAAAAVPAAPSKRDYAEQFKILARNTSGRATAAIVEKVLQHRHIYAFSDMLALDCVQKLRGTDSDGMLKALETFAYGRFRDYEQHKAALPSFDAVQLKKLRQLTLVSMGSASKLLTYDDMYAELGFDNDRELEDLIIASIYSELVGGKLNQAKRRFEVSWVVGRDLRPGDEDVLIDRLAGWCEQSEKVLARLQGLAEDVKAQQAIAVKKQDAQAVTVASMHAEASARPSVSAGFGGYGAAVGFGKRGPGSAMLD